MNVLVVTKIPSPYQVELFDAIAERAPVELRVAYLRARDPDRSWADRPLRHAALFLDGGEEEAARAMRQSHLVVFGWYRDHGVARLMARRARSRLPWCFWGERPGFNFRGAAGTLYRRLRLWRLWADSRVPVWGIGHWAIEGYRREFGARRSYFHVPYVSNLRPFFAIDRNRSTQALTILFSGSLIERKGILELCEAFAAISRSHPAARLVVLGGGPLEHELRAAYAHSTQIEFLGFRDWDQLAAAYAGADILCAPSRYDGWGLVVAEAMAAGMPVIATTQMGAAREMVTPGETGWLVPPASAAALARSLESALAMSAGDLAAMRIRCRHAARAYDVDAGVARFVHAANESLQASAAPPAASGP